MIAKRASVLWVLPSGAEGAGDARAEGCLILLKYQSAAGWQPDWRGRGLVLYGDVRPAVRPGRAREKTRCFSVLFHAPKTALIFPKSTLRTLLPERRRVQRPA